MGRIWRRAAAGLLLALAAGSGAGGAEPAPPAGKLYEMEVLGVAPDPASGTPLVFLRARQERRELAMFIGPFEAQGIVLPLQGMRPPRPYTHDLALEAIHRLEGRVKRVVITEMRENTYFALLVLESRGRELSLDARPSDAIGLALRANAPIYAAEPAFASPPRADGPSDPPRGSP